MVYVHGKSGERGGGGAVSLKGWRECSGIIEGGRASSENILRYFYCTKYCKLLNMERIQE